MYGKLALCFIGLSSGGVIAAGIFAFLAIIGVFPRLIGVTHTRCHVILYETLLILGGTCACSSITRAAARRAISASARPQQMLCVSLTSMSVR